MVIIILYILLYIFFINVSQPYRSLIFEIFPYRRIGAVSYLVSGHHRTYQRLS